MRRVGSFARIAILLRLAAMTFLRALLLPRSPGWGVGVVSNSSSTVASNRSIRQGLPGTSLMGATSPIPKSARPNSFVERMIPPPILFESV